MAAQREALLRIGASDPLRVVRLCDGPRPSRVALEAVMDVVGWAVVVVIACGTYGYLCCLDLAWQAWQRSRTHDR